MSARKNKTKTISEKITEVFLPKAEVDPENDPESLVKIVDFNGEDEEEGFDFDSKPSEIRKRNVKLLSEFSDKYKGKVTSRRELEESSEEGGSEDEANDDISDDSELEIYKDKLNGIQNGKHGRNKEPSIAEKSADEYQTSDDSELHDESGTNDRSIGTDGSSDTEEESGEEEVSDYADSTGDEDHQEEDQTQILTDTNQNSEIQKGLAVQNQLKIWEKLLEIRIHSQKMLTKANSLPLPAVYDKYCGQDDFSNLASTTIENVENLLDNMLEMQSLLSSQYSETKDIFKENRKRIVSAGKLVEPPLKRFARTLATNFDSFTPYQNSVLQKWDDRTRILSLGAGAKKGGKSLNDNFDIVKKIEAVLLNKSDLRAKSQTVKGNYKLFGSEKNRDTAENGKENSENVQTEAEKLISSTEIYDDTDFYHQQLRELIEFKSNTSTNPAEMSKQFAELQKLRQKMKKKVDTRASKGRKIRYVVHNKLVNFMAPNPNSDYTEESKNELYRSLFAT